MGMVGCSGKADTSDCIHVTAVEIWGACFTISNAAAGSPRRGGRKLNVRVVAVAPAPLIDVPLGTAKCSVIVYCFAPSSTSAAASAWPHGLRVRTRPQRDAIEALDGAVQAQRGDDAATVARDRLMGRHALLLRSG